MGDLVAVMQTGGILAQFGPPAELAAPASEFVARFVGADRGLKRLSLSRVGELPLDRRSRSRARRGEDRRPARERLTGPGRPVPALVDAWTRPIGWVDRNKLPTSGPLSADPAVPMSPLLDRRTTLKDALSMLLDRTRPGGHRGRSRRPRGGHHHHQRHRSAADAAAPRRSVP